MTEELLDKTVAEIDEEAKKRQDDLALMIFNQLLQSERFQQFFEKNYELRKVVDHEAMSIDFVLIEKHPEVVKKAEEPLIVTETAPKFKASKAKKRVIV